MTQIVWGQSGERFYETGIDRGVLYPTLIAGVAWNGLVSVEETVDGGESEPLYFDGIKYHDFVSAEFFEANLEAFSAPPEFAACDGVKSLSPGLYASQQPRARFGMSYRTLLGNDVSGIDLGYKLHLVYNATVLPATKRNQTVSNRAELNSRQWTIKTIPPKTTTYKPTAHFVVDSTKCDEASLATLEDVLYGIGGDDPRLPTQAEVISLLA